MTNNPESPYYDIFENWNDVQSNFQMKEDEPDEVFVAGYSYEDYSGYSEVVYRRGTDYFIASGSHCSCYGLEGQWEPERYDKETLLVALKKRHQDETTKIALKNLGEES